MSDIIISSIEDDESISLIISKTLQKQGYQVFSYFTGESFLDDVMKNKPNVILLDLMLPGIQGKEVLKEIKKHPELDDSHIIVVSAKSLLNDKVELLDLGADNYLTKPFEIAELISRVNAQARRNKNSKNNIKIRKGPYTLDSERGILFKKNRPIHLTASEFLIFKKLIEVDGKIVSRKELFACFGGEGNESSKALDMHIRSLRSKLGQGSIVSVYGSGYRIVL